MSDFNLASIATGVWETIYNLFTSIANNFINNITDTFGAIIPVVGELINLIVQLFELVLPSVVFCFDAMLISPGVVVLLISVLLYRISVKYLTYYVKLVLDWWHRIAP